jgi:hypothetical protein
MSLMPVSAKPTASSLLSQSFPPAPGGMNVSIPANEIQDTEAVYLQDILLDQPGIARRRGPVSPVPGMAALSRPGSGIVMTLDPEGYDKYGVLNGNASNGYFTTYNRALSTVTDLAWPYSLPTNPSGGQPYQIVDAAAALTNGALIGVSSAYDSNAPNQALAYWAGGSSPNYTTGTITVTRGSATITGSGTAFAANVTPGMFLFANTDDPYTNAYIGIVLHVVSDTQLTLQQVSPYAATAKSFTLQSLRGIAPKVATGTITCDVSAKTVNGGDTKFRTQGLGTGTWDIYRSSDLTWIGTVDSAATITDTSLSLKANAAISVADEAYVALMATADFNIITTQSTQKVGFLTSVYALRQWYANNGGEYDKTYRLWFSDQNDHEALDLTQDGNWIPINSTGDIQEPVIALATSYNALVVLKETEAFAVYGSDPTTFQVLKLEDDGAISGMSVQQFGGGVLWAGRQGIHYYDGVQVQNLTEQKLGNIWRNTFETFDPSKYRMWSMIERNHYILHMESLSPSLAVVKGNVASTPNHWVVVINLDTGAVTLWQNVKLRGAVTLPATSGHEVWYIVNDGTKAVVCEASSFFDAEGIDNEVEGVTNGGPDFYFESKKFDGGNPTRLKRFRYFILHYLIGNGSVEIDTVMGLNNIGTTLSTTFPATVLTWSQLPALVGTWTGLKQQFPTWTAVIQNVFKPKRVRFLKSSQLMSFRLWQSSNAVTRFQVGPFEIGFKEMRPGRV